MGTCRQAARAALRKPVEVRKPAAGIRAVAVDKQAVVDCTAVVGDCTSAAAADRIPAAAGCRNVEHPAAPFASATAYLHPAVPHRHLVPVESDQRDPDQAHR